METLLLLLVLLQVKHCYFDFLNQTQEEIQHKGTYLDWRGVKHSVKQGLGTFICFIIITGWSNIIFCILIGVLDVLLHYHIDWLKMNYGNKDIKTKEFWHHFGLDQLAHQLTYVFLIFISL
jgi:hypothetical protein